MAFCLFSFACLLPFCICLSLSFAYFCVGAKHNSWINSYRVLPPSDCAYTYTMCLGVLLLSAWYWKSARNIKHDGSCFGSFANPARPDNKLTLHRILSGSNPQSLVGLKPSEVQVQERPAEPHLFICFFVTSNKTSKCLVAIAALQQPSSNCKSAHHSREE